MANMDDYLLVAAIDFGTTFSGFAFSFRHEFNVNPLLVSAPNWEAQSGSLISQKSSTCVLFDPEKHFHSFGYKAEDKYEELVFDEEHHNWYMFRRFKMHLYNAKTLQRDFLLYDVAGKPMPAMQVFSATLKAIKDILIETCKTKNLGLEEKEIKWVLTVPAIWTDAAKQFMREAAELAGIQKTQLLLALEPEAASLYCKYLPMAKRGGVGYEAFQTGTKYMVIDAGGLYVRSTAKVIYGRAKLRKKEKPGGTVDITVHQVLNESRVKEIYKANGGNWGGTAVDGKFCDMLSCFVGKKCFELFKEKQSYDFLDLMRKFEVKKRLAKADGDYNIIIEIPVSLLELCVAENEGRSLKDMLPSHKNNYKCSVVANKLRLSSDCVQEFFIDPIKKLVDHIQRLCEETNVRGVTTLLMVGGFSESDLLQSMIRETFPQFSVAVPQEAGLAVLKGAVIFGHDPSAIGSRICRFTYGVDVSKTFIPGQHDDDKKFVSGLTGETLCRDTFDVYVTKGQSVDIGEPLKTNTRTYIPTSINQKTMYFTVYLSDEETPTYVDDQSCTKLGRISVDISGLPSKDQKVDVIMTFSKTEFEVKATARTTGKSMTANFDFLQ